LIGLVTMALSIDSQGIQCCGERRDELDNAACSLFEEVVERTEERERWAGRPFSRRRVNSGATTALAIKGSPHLANKIWSFR
jgi:hypothetical protein